MTLPPEHLYLLASLPRDNSEYVLLYRPETQEPDFPAPPVSAIDLNTVEISVG